MRRGEGRKRALSLVGATEADVALYTRHLPVDGGRVLVLGAADGRIARALVAHGARAVAVDPSARMIQAAEEGRTELPPDARPRLELLEADLRSLRLGTRFGAVFAPQDAVALMSNRADLESLFATVAGHLGPGAPFVFDVRVPARLGGAAEAAGPHEPIAPERPLFAPHLRSRRRGLDPSSDLRRLRLRPFTVAEIEAALAATGLQALQRDGDFHGKAWAPEDSRVVILAQAG